MPVNEELEERNRVRRAYQEKVRRQREEEQRKAAEAKRKAAEAKVKREDAPLVKPPPEAVKKWRPNPIALAQPQDYPLTQDNTKRAEAYAKPGNGWNFPRQRIMPSEVRLPEDDAVPEMTQFEDGSWGWQEPKSEPLQIERPHLDKSPKIASTQAPSGTHTTPDVTAANTPVNVRGDWDIQDVQNELRDLEYQLMIAPPSEERDTVLQRVRAYRWRPQMVSPEQRQQVTESVQRIGRSNVQLDMGAGDASTRAAPTPPKKLPPWREYDPSVMQPRPAPHPPMVEQAPQDQFPAQEKELWRRKNLPSVDEKGMVQWTNPAAAQQAWRTGNLVRAGITNEHQLSVARIQDAVRQDAQNNTQKRADELNSNPLTQTPDIGMTGTIGGNTVAPPALPLPKIAGFETPEQTRRREAIRDFTKGAVGALGTALHADGVLPNTIAGRYVDKRAEERAADDLTGFDALGTAAMNTADKLFLYPQKEIETANSYNWDGTPRDLTVGQTLGIWGGMFNKLMNPALKATRQNPDAYTANELTLLEAGYTPQQIAAMTPEQQRAALHTYSDQTGGTGLAQALWKWGQTQADRLAASNQQIRASNTPDADLAIINGLSGADAQQQTFLDIQAKANVEQLRAEETWLAANGHTQAAQYARTRRLELEAATFTDLIDKHANSMAELVSGTFLDPTSVADVGIGGLVAMRRGMEVVNAAQDVLTPGKIAEEVVKGVNEAATGIFEAGRGYSAINNAPGGVGLINRSKAYYDKDIVGRNAAQIINGLTNTQDANRLVNLWLMNPQALIDGVSVKAFTDPYLLSMAGSDGLIRFGENVVASKDLLARSWLTNLMLPDVGQMRVFKNEGVFDPINFLSQFDELAYKHASARYGLDEGTLVDGVRKWTGADLARGVAGDYVLNMNPSHWLRNALDANLKTMADDIWSLTPEAEIDEYLGGVAAASSPTHRLFETNTAAGDEQLAAVFSHSPTSAVATALSGNPNNIVSTTLPKLQDLWMGNTRIGDLPFGEQAGYKMAFYNAFKKQMPGNLKKYGKSYTQELIRRGVPEEMAQEIVGAWMSSMTQNPSVAKAMDAAKRVINGDTIPITLQTLGIKPEDLSPSAYPKLNEIMEWLIKQPDRSAPEVEQQFMARTNALLQDEQKRWAAQLQGNPLPIGQREWTTTTAHSDAANAMDDMSEVASRLGVQVPPEAQAQIAEASQHQIEISETIAQEFRGTPDIAIAIFEDTQQVRQKERLELNRLAHEAMESDDKASAWQAYWESSKQVRADSAAQQDEIIAAARTAAVNGVPYGKQQDYYANIEKFINWDSEAIRDVEFASQNALRMGSVADPQLERVIRGHRRMADRSRAILFETANRFAGTDALDVVISTQKHADALGAAAASYLVPYREQMLAGQLPLDEYYKLRNKVWREYAEDRVILDGNAARLIVLRGSQDNIASQVKWAADGQSYSLLGEAEDGYWLARAEDGSQLLMPEKDVPEQAIAGYQKVREGLQDEINKVIANVQASLPASDPKIQELMAKYGPPLSDADQNAIAAERAGVADELQSSKREGYVRPGDDAAIDSPVEKIGVAPAAEPAPFDATTATWGEVRQQINKLNKELQHPALSVGERNALEAERDALQKQMRGMARDPLPALSPVEEAQAIHDADNLITNGYVSNGVARNATSDFVGEVKKSRGLAEQKWNASVESAADPSNNGAYRDAMATLTPDEIKGWSAHGVGYDGVQGTAQEESLANLLQNGADPNREFFTGGLQSSPDGNGFLQTRDTADYIVLYPPGADLHGKPQYVVVNGHAADSIPMWQAQFPDVQFLTPDEAAALVKGGTGGGMLVAPSAPAEYLSMKDSGMVVNKTDFQAAGNDVPLYQQVESMGQGGQDFSAGVPSPKTRNPADDWLGVGNSRLGVPAGQNANDFVFRQMVANQGIAPGANGPDTAHLAAQQIEHINGVADTIWKNLDSVRQAQPNTLNAQERIAAQQVIDQNLPKDLGNLVQAQVTQAKRVADMALLDNSQRRGADEWVSLFVPFHYFHTRSPYNWLKRMARKPGIANKWYETARAISTENKQSGVPDRLAGTVPLITLANGEQIRLQNPLQSFFPYSYLGDTRFNNEDETNSTFGKWYNNVRAYAPGLLPQISLAADAIQDKIDPLPNGETRVGRNYLGQIIPQYQVGAMAAGALGIGFGGTGGQGNWSNATDDFQPYRIDRAINIIGVSSKTPSAVVAAARQIVYNTKNGRPAEEGIDPALLEQAQQLYQQGVQQASADRLATVGGRMATGVGAYVWRPEEKELAAQASNFFAGGYDPQNNPYGSKAQQQAIASSQPAMSNWLNKGVNAPAPDPDMQNPVQQQRLSEYMTARNDLQQQQESEISKYISNHPNATEEQIWQIRNKYAAERDKLKEQYSDVQIPEGSTAGMNPEEQARKVIAGFASYQPPNKPENPGDNATPAEKAAYYKALGEWERKRLDYIDKNARYALAQSPGEPFASELKKLLDGKYAAEVDRDYEAGWQSVLEEGWQNQVDFEKEMTAAERNARAANVAKLTGYSADDWAIYSAANADQRKELAAQNPAYYEMVEAAYNPDEYAAAVKLFGDDWYKTIQAEPDYPGESTPEYEKAYDEWLAQNPRGPEIKLWYKGRGTQYGAAPEGYVVQKDYGEQWGYAVKQWGEDIFALQQERANVYATQGKDAGWAWDTAHPTESGMIKDFNMWRNALKEQDPIYQAKATQQDFGDVNDYSGERPVGTDMQPIEPDANAIAGLPLPPDQMQMGNPPIAPEGVSAAPAGVGTPAAPAPATGVPGGVQQAPAMPPSQPFVDALKGGNWKTDGTIYPSGYEGGDDTGDFVGKGGNTSEAAQRFQDARNGVYTQFGDTVGYHWDKYNDLPAGSDERKKYLDENPELRLAIWYGHDADTYAEAQELFGDDALKAWAFIPPAGDARTEYYIQNPVAWAVQTWVWGRWDDSDDAQDEGNDERDYGKDWNEAIKLFGDDIWQVAMQYRAADKAGRNAMWNDRIGQFWDWFYGPREETGASAYDGDGSAPLYHAGDFAYHGMTYDEYGRLLDSVGNVAMGSWGSPGGGGGGGGGGSYSGGAGGGGSALNVRAQEMSVRPARQQAGRVEEAQRSQVRPTQTRTPNELGSWRPRSGLGSWRTDKVDKVQVAKAWRSKQ